MCHYFFDKDVRMDWDSKDLSIDSLAMSSLYNFFAL